jgi:spore maturation protein CgeB
MSLKIAYIGNFTKMWDEEYIARGFEALGCEILRVPEMTRYTSMIDEIVNYKPDVVLFAKFNVGNPEIVMSALKKHKLLTVCWVWDLYWGYIREHYIKNKVMFQADIVITSDGGNDKRWKEAGIKHYTVRQGIRNEECYARKAKKTCEVLFVGSENPYNQRNSFLSRLEKDYGMSWVGKVDTNQCRGEQLNELYAKTKIVVGDSVYSPYYWSNRIVETLGRGGFLIHQEVEGLQEEYPQLVTYKRDDYEDLCAKIDYYLANNKEREQIVRKNVEHVRNHHLITHECKKVIDICKESLKTK